MPQVAHGAGAVGAGRLRTLTGTGWSGQTRRHSSPGVYVPAGSLDIWRAARANHTTQLVEAVHFGDSTTDFGNDGNAPGYVARMRALALAAGYTDGGRGLVHDEPASATGENLAPVLTRSGFTHGGGSYDFFATSSFGDGANGGTGGAAGNYITIQGHGRYCRLHYSVRSYTGGFSYAVDGGPATVVETRGVGPTNMYPLMIDLGTSAMHTVTITNLGGAPSGETRTGGSTIVFSPDFLKATGLVFHNHGISGSAMGLLPSGGQNAPWGHMLALGISPTAVIGANTHASYVNGTDPTGNPILPFPPGRDPKVATINLGINGAADATKAPTLYTGATTFARNCRAAGVDPIVIIPHFERSTNPPAIIPGCRDALIQAATDQGCAWVDFDYALDAGGHPAGPSGPHLANTGYDIEAQFLWSVLSA